ALLYGGKLVIIPRDAARDTHRFLRILEDEKVTVLSQTPAAFYNLIHEDLGQPVSRLAFRYVVFGGEALKPLLLRPFHERHPNTRLINMYGITETTVHVTFKEIGDDEIERNISNIGRAIPTLKTYIMDKNLTLLPIGIAGELCVSGDGVGRGYLNQPELTAQKFVPNPYVPGEMLYRSGDLARLYAQGDLEYLGRIDNQVKIRGHRIELGEIESTLLQHDAIQEVIVLTKENLMGTHQLCAYYVPSSEITVADLKKHLARCLPDYMIPSYFIHVEKMPLTSNGKVDRARLPAPEDNIETAVVYVSPETPLQMEIADVWGDILEIDTDRIGIDDEFFALGGDSLSAIRVVAKLGGGLAGADLYENPTIRTLALRVHQLRDAKSNELVIQPNQEQTLIASAPVPQLPLQQDLTAPADLLRRLTGPLGAASRMLVCFPYGGGSAYNYKSLADAIRDISPDTAVYAVAPPGHEFGRIEDFLPIAEIARRVVDEILRKFCGPIFLYAHCVGTALAVESVRLLEQEGRRVDGFFTGAILPPRIAGLFGRPFDPWRPFSDHSVLALLRRIGLPDLQVDPAFAKFAMRAFRHDVADFYKYFHAFKQHKQPLLSTPVHILVGDEDSMTRHYASLQHVWTRYAREYTLSVLPKAGHYFIHSHPKQVASLLLDAVAAPKPVAKPTFDATVERTASGGV
ncbi:MAG TPA: alpha/beta fold hydrolase, partial [Clostridia bacterium]